MLLRAVTAATYQRGVPSPSAEVWEGPGVERVSTSIPVTSTRWEEVMMARHRKHHKRSPSERPCKDPSEGLTRRELYADAIKLSLALLKIVDLLFAWLTALR